MSALFMYDVSYAVMFYAEINLSIYCLEPAQRLDELGYVHWYA